MSVRDIAAADRAHILKSSAYGIGEATQWLPLNGMPVDIKATWVESATDKRDPHNLIDSQFGRMTVDVLMSDVPGLTRADQLRRMSSGVIWSIEEMEIISGVGYRLIMTRRAQEDL